MNLLCLRARECIKRLGCDEATLVAAKQPNVGTALGLLAEVFHLAAAQFAPADKRLTQWMNMLGHREPSLASN